MSQSPGPGAVPPDLPGYRFIKPIGAGGNAQVYLYEQNLPRRKVAVKVLNESALSETARRRFIAEANVTAGLPHRHIVQVFDAKVTDDGQPYIVMPYYPQPNMSVRARRSHFSVADVLRIGIQIGSAVETSHRSGVLHRDIKPQNILTDSYGEPALTDFGIATTKGGDGPEGLSLPWSPPEIIFGIGAGDERADVYSLGATLWHLLAGRSPFEVPGDNGALALMGRIKSEPPPGTGRSDVPDSLERLLRQAMAKDPHARPQSAMELIRGLQSVEQELRLPVTQPVLLTDEPPGDTRGGDTIAHPHLRGADDTHRRRTGPDGPADPRPPDSPRSGATPGLPQPGGPARGNTSQTGWGAPPRGDTVARGAGAAGPQVPRAPGDNDNVTLKRGPIRIDPGGPPAGSRDQAAPGRGPAGFDAWGNAPAPGAPRVRQFPREAPEGATVARPFGGPGSLGATDAGASGRTGPGFGGTTAGAPGAVAPGPRGSGRGRLVALVGGGAALAVVAGVAVVALSHGPSHGGGQPGGAPASAGLGTQDGALNAIGPAAPGTPAVTATRLSATQVKFSWTYDNPAPHDTFPWTVSGTVGNSSGVATEPERVVTVPAGKVACFEVKVRSAAGQVTSDSPEDCWP